MVKFFRSILLIALLSATAFSQDKIAPPLLDAIDEAIRTNGTVHALVMLSDAVDIQTLDRQLYQQKVSVQDRAYIVITTLQQKALETQGPLLSYLASLPSTEVVKYQSFWVANMIAVEATPAVIMELSARAEVEYLQIDGILERDEPVNSAPAEMTPNGSEPGLRAINAHKMWQAGYTGAGTIVMGIDTGVDGNHPALNYKWRGTHVPASQAWFDPNTGTNFPNDCDGHGTHTIGTMNGLQTSTSDTVGVAPGAEWIAAKTLCAGTHTSASIAAFQWAMDPDGNPGTTDDMPVGIGNSWYDPNIPSASQCNPAQNPYINVLTAVEAAGIAVVFSAGNSGPSASSITSPKNVNIDEVHFWATGAVDGNNPAYPIASFSSRGPVVAACSTGVPSLDIKPEASAPGVSVRSSYAGGGYQFLSGTSMACPHVVGALALLKEAHPGKTGHELKMALYQTAVDLGAAGEDNTYGMGIIDVWAAHESLADPNDPNDPENVTAYSDYTTPSSVLLNWTDPTTYVNGDPLTNFSIEIFRDGALAASVASGLETYTDLGLNDGQFYQYTVFAKDNNDSLSGGVDVSAYAGGSPVPAPPTGLAATTTTSDATLTWTDPTTQSDGTPLDDLDHINIYRDGVLVGSVAPGVETYTDAPPPGFFYNYTVTAVDNETPPNESAPSNAAGGFVGSAPSYLVWVGPDAVGASAASGDSLFDALVANGQSALLTNNLFEFGTDLSIYDGIFVVLGIYSNNHVIASGDPEGAALNTYVQGGGRIFLEGGDCFNYDPETGGYNIRPWFALNDGPDGSGDVSGVTGLNDLSAFSFTYNGDNNWMDELQVAGSTPIWKNSANADISGVFNVGAGGVGLGRAIGVVPSFGGFVDSPEPLSPRRRTMENYLPQPPLATEIIKPRPQRGERQPFVKKAAWYPERKGEINRNELYRITPNGIEMLANTKEDLMAAYLELFGVGGGTDPEITVEPSALADTLLTGSNATHVLSISNTGGSLAGDLTWNISENPAVTWLEVTPAAGTTTANQTTEVSVQFNAGGLSAGNYSTTLEIASNAANSPLVTVPVNLLVSDAPVMVVTPETLDVTLPPGQSTAETFNISNPGVGPLEFAITIEGVAAANAKVDIIRGGEPINDEIIAVGRQVPRSQWGSLTQTSLNTADAGDASLPFVSGLAKGTPPFIEGEEIFGGTQFSFGPLGTRGRGNHFFCSTSTNLTEHRLYLNFSVASDLQFLVYEGTAQVGAYTLINVSNIASAGPGQGWYSSGPIDVPLVAGRYYMIFPQWTAAANYYNNQNIVPYPIPASFGELQMGVGWNYAPTYAVPPPATQTVTAAAFGAAVAYYQTIVTGAGTSWLSVSPEDGVVNAGSNTDITVTFNSTDLLGGDYYANIIVSGNDPANPADTVLAHLYVTGEALIRANPAAVVFPDPVFVNSSDETGLWVANDGNGVLTVSDITIDNPVFSVDQTAFTVPPFDSVEVTVTFAPTAAGTVMGSMTIISDASNNPALNVPLQGTGITGPQIDVDPETIDETLNLGDSTDVPVTISNIAPVGAANLDWSAEIFLSKTTLRINPVFGPVTGDAAEARHPRSVEGHSYSLVTEGFFDLQYFCNLENLTGALGNAGAEFDGTYGYTTRWASNLLHKFDITTCTMIEEFSIPGVTGLRDLAYDGAFMYGGAAATTIYQMDFTTKTLIGTIPSPVAVRHIAYDEGADAFWVGTWDTPPTLVSRTGQVLGTLTSGLLSQYGSAYDNYTVGGPYLWVFNQGSGAGFPQLVHQFDLSTGTATGFTYDVAADFQPNASAIAGGLWVGEGVVPGSSSLGGVLQGTPDVYFVYDLGVGVSQWMQLIGDNSGSIAPGDVGGFNIRLRGEELGLYQGSVVISSNDQTDPIVTVPVTLDVIVGLGEEGEVPATFDISRNYPNPFNPSTTLDFQLPQVANVKLEIYNVLGQKVRTLVDAQMQPGRYKATWDGRNDTGAAVTSGVYIYRFVAGDFKSVQKMVLMK